MGVFEKKSAPEAQVQTADRDEALFHSLQKKKKARRRRVIRTVVIVVVLVAIALTAGVLYLRRSIARRLVSDDDVSSAKLHFLS